MKEKVQRGYNKCRKKSDREGGLVTEERAELLPNVQTCEETRALWGID